MANKAGVSRPAVIRVEADRAQASTLCSVLDVIDRLPGLGPRAAYVKQALRDKLIEHNAYIRAHGEDMPEIREWRWRPIDPRAV